MVIWTDYTLAGWFIDRTFRCQCRMFIACRQAFDLDQILCPEGRM